MADDYAIEIRNDCVVATHNDGSERLVFPFHWKDGKRAYTYRSIDRPLPTVETWDGADWTSQTMDLATFAGWMARLEDVAE